jgi:glycine/D-amino acid oxidase-like deaminating enzyme
MAYQLSSEGYDVIVIDKRDIAMGSTSATTAMIQYELDEPLHTLIKKVGKDAAVDTYKEGVRAIHKLEGIIDRIQVDCGFKRKNSLYVAHNKKALSWLEKEFEARRKIELPVSWMTKSALVKQNVIGEGAILSMEGSSLDAYRLAHGLLAFSADNYALKVYDHTIADNIDFGKENHRVTTNRGKTITGKFIVFATGYETQYFLKKKIVQLHSTYALISEPFNIPAWLKETIIWNTQDPYLYVRTTPDNRILVGGHDEAFKNSTLRNKLIEEKQRMLVESYSQLLPELKFISDFAWAGTFGVTKDALPYIGMNEKYPNCFFVLGFGGNGITFSVMGMDMLSDALAGRDNKFLDYYSFSR